MGHPSGDDKGNDGAMNGNYGGDGNECQRTVEEEDGISQHSHMSQHSGVSQHSGGEGGCFFADMTLDLTEAHLEATPRSDLKFASMAKHDKSEDIERNVPALPLLEAADDVNDRNGDAADDERNHARISSDDTNGPLEVENGRFPRMGRVSFVNESTHSTSSNLSHVTTPRPRIPRRPRDVSWTAAAMIFMPLGLIVPHFYYPDKYVQRHNQCDLAECTPLHPSWAKAALSPATHPTVLFSALISAAFSVALLRLLYSSPGGGEGDDLRHAAVTRTFLLSSNLSVLLNPLLAILIWHRLPDARPAAILPLGLATRDAWRARNAGGPSPSFRGPGARRGGAGPGASSSRDRRTFFRALACAALDILSRSLRRRSFVRAATALLGLQLACVLSWWNATKAVLSVRAYEEDGIATKFAHGFLLGLVASGGVTSWFAQQTAIIEEIGRRETERRRSRGAFSRETERDDDGGRTGGADVDDPVSGCATNYAAARAAHHAMPEAYRMADASVYASVMDFDDGLDDDYDDEGEEEAMFQGQRHVDAQSTVGSSLGQQTSTVKSFLKAGCTVSFGSVAQCGLVGGLAQFLWSLVRNMDAMGFFLSSRFSYASSSGFRGMDVSVDPDGRGRSTNPRQWKQTLEYWWRTIDVAIRAFVRGHSDLAMSHVAGYFKSYQKAANDVAALIESSGGSTQSCLAYAFSYR